MSNICSIWHLQYLLMTLKVYACFGVKYVEYYFCVWDIAYG